MTRDKLIEAMARAIVEAPSVPWDAPIDWGYISRDPENEWYMAAKRKATAALQVVERELLDDTLRSLISQEAGDTKALVTVGAGDLREDVG